MINIKTTFRWTEKTCSRPFLTAIDIFGFLLFCCAKVHPITKVHPTLPVCLGGKFSWEIIYTTARNFEERMPKKMVFENVSMTLKFKGGKFFILYRISPGEMFVHYMPFKKT